MSIVAEVASACLGGESEIGKGLDKARVGSGGDGSCGNWLGMMRDCDSCGLVLNDGREPRMASRWSWLDVGFWFVVMVVLGRARQWW
ncbi:hypothetical protein M0R45_009109 [Rubus argutus]|uniref:Transmembrane protein n=1 Tax=Rubus argutus TaxID=59490 RepID=A0AAW1Y405_RUBAR